MTRRKAKKAQMEAILAGLDKRVDDSIKWWECKNPDGICIMPDDIQELWDAWIPGTTKR